MLTRFLAACALLVAMCVAGCSSLDQPEAQRKFVGQPGRRYTMERRGYVIRQSLIYAVNDLDRILLLDRPSMVHPEFVDY